MWAYLTHLKHIRSLATTKQRDFWEGNAGDERTFIFGVLMEGKGKWLEIWREGKNCEKSEFYFDLCRI